MRRVIRSRKTGALWKEGLWVYDPRQAEHFPNVESLLLACAKHQLREVEMVLQFEGAETPEICIPLTGPPNSQEKKGEK